MPGSIDHDAVVSQVVDLLTVNITWPLPIDNNAPITGYRLSYCYGNIQPNSSCVLPNMVFDMEMVEVVIVGDASVSAIVPLDVNSMVELNITALNSRGEGMLLNAPYVFTTATSSK